MIDPSKLDNRYYIDNSLPYYLSGPMSGIPEYNYPAFERAAQFLRSVGLKIESPHENPWPQNYRQLSQEDLWQAMMKLCYEQMDRCKGIILLKGWPFSRGANLELEYMAAKRYPVYYFHNYNLLRMD